MSRIVVTEPIHPDGIDLLQEKSGCDVVAIDAHADPDALRALMPGTTALLVRTFALPGALLAQAPDLAIVSKHGVGCDNIDVAHCSDRGIPVTIAADANATSVAEHAMMLMLACAKRLPAQDAATRAGDWAFRQRTEAFELNGRTVLVVGLGRIGRKIVPLCKAFGMRVIAYDPVTEMEGVERHADLSAALAEADIITLHTPLIDATRGLIDAQTLRHVRPGAILVNCARGGIADEPAVIAALQDGRLRMYGTDVFATEPMRADDPLLALPNVIATPHTGAMTAESARAMAMQSAENILAHGAGSLDPAVIINARALGRP